MSLRKPHCSLQLTQQRQCLAAAHVQLLLHAWSRQVSIRTAAVPVSLSTAHFSAERAVCFRSVPLNSVTKDADVHGFDSSLPSHMGNQDQKSRRMPNFVCRSYSLPVKDRGGRTWEFVIKSWANGTENRRVYVLEQTGEYLKVIIFVLPTLAVPGLHALL